MPEDNSGFHYVRTDDNNGTHVSGFLLDDALPIVGNSLRPWKYDQCVYGAVPEEARNAPVTADRNFYTAFDLEELAGWSEQETKQRARKYKWRYRVDSTSKCRGFYLYDILASDWQHMLDFPDNTLDQALYAEAAGLAQGR